MGAKEKAKELIDKFEAESFAGIEFYRKKNAKRTALICINEILEELGEDILPRAYKYWLDVKKEVERI